MGSLDGAQRILSGPPRDWRAGGQRPPEATGNWGVRVGVGKRGGQDLSARPVGGAPSSWGLEPRGLGGAHLAA